MKTPRRKNRPATAALFVAAFALPCLGLGDARAQSPAFTASAHSSLETFRTENPPAPGQDSIRLSAARGETESFQLILTPRTAEALRDIRISVSGLGDVEPKIYAASAIHVTTPSRSSGAKAGHVFDLLRPPGGEAIASGGFRPYWIDLNVPPNSVAGERVGAVTITVSGGSQTLPIRLRVRNFSLPAIPSLQLAFAFTPSRMEAYYGRPLTRPEVHAAQDAMLEHRLGPVPMWGGGDELFNDEARLRQCLKRGLNVILLHVEGETDARIEQSLDALEPKIALLRKVGALDRTFFFGYDEVTVNHPERMPAMRKAYARFHARHPEIVRINTSQPDDRLAAVVDIFVVPTALFVPAMTARKGHWWYSVGNDDLENEPDFRIDYPPVVHRGFFLADWKAGVRGHLYWAVEREWPDNRAVKDRRQPEADWRTGYTNIFSGKWIDANGGGNLFYPDGSGKLFPSPRAKRVRDGIEDYEYLAQLRLAATQLETRQPSGWQALATRARILLTVPDSVASIGDGWRTGWTATASDEPACSGTMHPNAIRSGKRALRILPNSAGVTVTQSSPITAGESGSASVWIKTADLTGKARLIATYRGADGTILNRVESAPATGSTPKFVELKITLPPAPPAARTLHLGIQAQTTTPAAGPNAPLQKVFVDDFSLRLGDRAVALVNPGFEAEKLRLNFDPLPLLDYRDALADCLGECVTALGAAARAP